MYQPQNGAEVRLWKTAQKMTELGDLWVAAPHCNEQPSNDIEWIDLTSPLFTWQPIWNDLWTGLFLFHERHPLRKLLTRALVTKVNSRDITFDVIICEFPQVTDAAVQLSAQHDAAMLLNKHNAAHTILDGYLRERSVPKHLRHRAVENLYSFEQQAIRAADVTVFQSENDQTLFEEMAGVETFVIPNGCDFQWIRSGGNPEQAARECGVGEDTFTCVFLGSYDYAPNKRAAKVIINEIAPKFDDINFLLIGRNPPSTSVSNVYTPGYVDELPGVLQLADVALCPLFSGSGTKLKMLDYLAAGLPIITTPVGAQGLTVENGKEVLIYEDADGFVSGIKRLRSSNELRRRLATAGSEIASHHSWDSLMDQYDKVFEVITDKRDT
ncbi:glycosyltransferase family 4 protein [Haloarcula sp. NS06]|uniref:glycosyltransferase family 4 protein n=1 Tax=Haloarcula sp. NS06 TaxID=3409688 RepID=UPI003DA70384